MVWRGLLYFCFAFGDLAWVSIIFGGDFDDLARILLILVWMLSMWPWISLILYSDSDDMAWIIMILVWMLLMWHECH